MVSVDHWHNTGHSSYAKKESAGPGPLSSAGSSWGPGPLPKSGDDPAPSLLFFKDIISGDVTSNLVKHVVLGGGESGSEPLERVAASMVSNEECIVKSSFLYKTPCVWARAHFQGTEREWFQMTTCGPHDVACSVPNCQKKAIYCSFSGETTQCIYHADSEILSRENSTPEGKEYWPEWKDRYCSELNCWRLAEYCPIMCNSKKCRLHVDSCSYVPADLVKMQMSEIIRRKGLESQPPDVAAAEVI